MAFERKWSDDLKRAVVAAVLDYEMSVPKAVAAAHAGELPGAGRGVPGAPIPVATVRDLVTAERRRRKLQESARAAPEEIVGRTIGVLAAILDREAERLEAQARRGKCKPADIVAVARAGAEVAKLAKLVGNAPSSPEKANPQKQDASDFIGSLAQQ